MATTMPMIEQQVERAHAEIEKHVIWDRVATGIWETYVSRFPSDKDEEVKPEFAVLRLSAERYEEFQRDRKEFFNRYRIFDKDIRKQEVFSAAKPQNQEVNLPYWYLLAIHWPSSTLACHAYAEWGEPAS